MSIIHFSCLTGVSGDMLLASMLDMGVSLEELESGLAGMNLNGFKLIPNKKNVAGIETLHLDVRLTRDQPLRHYSDLKGIIQNAELPDKVKADSLTTIRLLGEAEAKVHGIALEEVHFHEIGAVDTLIDIVGAHLLIHKISPDQVTTTPINLGSGFVSMAHGRHPVPAPACAELSIGMMVFGSDLGKEAATPTGLALIKSLAQEYTEQPEGVVKRIGYGSGGYSGDDFPTYVRAVLIDN